MPPQTGIEVVSSSEKEATAAVDDVRRGLRGGPFAHILFFFSTGYDESALARAMKDAFPGVATSGCSTAGGIGPAGMVETGLIAVALPRATFRVFAEVIEDLQTSGVERATEIARQLKGRVSAGTVGSLADRAFGLLLVDGLSMAEEALVAAIHWAFDDIELVGGSAGDALEFRQTHLIHDGAAFSNGAILLLVETDRPFRIFKTENLEPTETKLVVTSANAEERIVYELNAEPAAREYASSIGLMPDELGPFSFASYPLTVKVGGKYYSRSIRNMNADGSLSFFCAIDEGLVFTVGRPTDMVQATASVLGNLEQELNGLDLVLSFDCVLRRLDFEARQIRRPMEELYMQHRVVGFHTYGEQLNAMHLNQTLTGIAFGSTTEGT